MLPVSRARDLGSTSCLIAQTPRLWLLGAVESAVYGPIRVSSSHSTLEGILPCLAHPALPSPCSSLRFRAEFLPQPPLSRRARGLCSGDVLAPLGKSDNPEAPVALVTQKLACRRGSGCEPRCDKSCNIHAGVTWAIF